MSFASSASSSSRVLAPAYAADLYSSHPTPHDDDPAQLQTDAEDGLEEHPVAASNKGKGREQPPTLPPLSFTPTDFLYGSPDWPSVAGPSSYGSNFSDPTSAHSTSPDMDISSAPPSTPSSPEAPIPQIRPRVPSRARSLSNLSLRSRHSVSGLSMNKVKVKLAGSKLPGNLAKKLFKRRDDPPSTPSSPASEPDILVADAALVEVTMPGLDVVGQGNCFVPWSRDMKPRTPLATPVVGTEVAWGSIDPVCRSPRPMDPHSVRTKGRSYSSPLPLPSSPFDIVPIAPADIFAPITAYLPNYFDEVLPHELKVQILAAMIHLHEMDHERRLSSAKWTAIKAASSKNRWVGRDKGIRELFKLSRVSHSWRSLVFDGQLWTKLDLRSFPKLPTAVIDRLCQTAGAFISSIDFGGHASIRPANIHDLMSYISVLSGPGDLTPSNTQLTSINLRGCTLLTTHSLHTLLIRSPLLKHLCVRGLSAVTNTTCEILASYCPSITTLDMNRCPNMNAEGVHSFATNFLTRGESTKLTVLRISGAKRFTDEMMAALGRAAPLLEVLDISCARDLHNSAVEAFVACIEGDVDKFETVQLSAREAGRDPTDTNRVWRRVTRLRHLSMSACPLLTDHACSHLAFAIPKLEFLELAGIGPALGEDGVVRLLATTPFIRRLDLEDATEISDDVLTALTPTRNASEPSPNFNSRTPPPPPEPGHALEQIILSYTDITNDSLQTLVRSCPRLSVLEVDNTRLSGSTLRDFVTRARERKALNARIVAIDCRNVSETLIKDMSSQTRARLGWRAWHARKLSYLDARDEVEGGDGGQSLLNIGQDECDETRVVVKTFYSWQTVDAVHAAREKRRKSSGSRRAGNGSSASGYSDDGLTGSSLPGRARWWSPSGRRSSGPATPTLLDAANGGDRDGCTIM
ncbi:RNI-like protein [Cristinia sonorae]|uniref:RNI-like protein n=1 Tax=Cristinia sonorae TaxID=1940300 RepID=A0A8K0USF4_9AGAR|nr:RNI-like protein [Cristinia sonorae]